MAVPGSLKRDFVQPPYTLTGNAAFVNDLIFDGLVTWDEHFTLIPRLAVSWEGSDDHREWTIHLRRSAKFHDGSEVTADDVKSTLEYAASRPSLFSYELGMIEHINVNDRYLLTIRLKRPSASFLSGLRVGIIPKNTVPDGTAVPSPQLPIGTGPYEVQSWSDNEVVLKANRDYFLGKPHIDRIVVRSYPNSEAAWSHLMGGDIDMFSFLSPLRSDLVQQVPAMRVYTALKPYYYLIALNLGSSLFAQKAVRQALNYAIDKDRIIRQVLHGYGRIAAGPIYPESWAYLASLEPYPYQPQRAATLLKQAGWSDHDGDRILDKNGRRFEFVVFVNRGDDLKQRVLLQVQQQLLDVGVLMNIKLFDPANIDFLMKNQFDAHFPEIDAGGDPGLNFRLWHSSQIRGGFNFGSYHNTGIDRLLEEGEQAFDPMRRKAIYGEFQRQFLEDPPGILLFWTDYLVGINRQLGNVKINPTGPFANITEWQLDNN